MFQNARNFNQPLSAWNVAKAVAAANSKFDNMLNGANKFQQNLCEWRIHNFQTEDGNGNMLTDTSCLDTTPTTPIPANTNTALGDICCNCASGDATVCSAV